MNVDMHESFKTIGLVLGDSLMKGVMEDSILKTDFMSHFGLDEIKSLIKPGATMEDLIGHRSFFTRQMYDINQEYKENYDVIVFIIAGANNLSNLINHNQKYFDKVIVDKYIQNRNDLLRSVCSHGQVHRVYIFPLTPRKLCCTSLQQNFPKYGDHHWIKIANQSINAINSVNDFCHLKVTEIPHQPQSFYSQYLHTDGIHLTKVGKIAFMRSSMNYSEPKNSFPIFNENDFPALPCRQVVYDPIPKKQMKIGFYARPPLGRSAYGTGGE